MHSPLAPALERLRQGLDLTPDETRAAFGEVMSGAATQAQIAALLLGLRDKGESAAEVAGAVRALREVMVPVEAGEGTPLVDTCGTGGGVVGTLNISTGAAFLAAAAGVRVAKHGNRSYTSRCGSADLLEALGVSLALDAAGAGRVLASVGMAFLFAPNFHPAMRHVAPVRRQLGVATIMNLVGPLANPAGVRRQVIGVADAARAPLVAEALVELGTDHAMVVHAEIGMDEISPTGRTTVLEIRGETVHRWMLDPATVHLEWGHPEELAGGEPAENADRIERLLEGRGREADRRAVLLNAAAAIYVSGAVDTYQAAVIAATEALESGRARRLLETLRRTR